QVRLDSFLSYALLASTDFYTLSLHDALPILFLVASSSVVPLDKKGGAGMQLPRSDLSPKEQILHVLNRLAYGPRPGDAERIEKTDRKSTRLNSSHDQISYAVFCLKKKTQTTC